MKANLKDLEVKVVKCLKSKESPVRCKKNLKSFSSKYITYDIPTYNITLLNKQ